MNRHFCCLFLIVIIFLCHQAYAWGPDRYDHTTHTDITAYAVEQSVLSKDHGDYLRNLGFTSNISSFFEWDVNSNGRIDGTDEQKKVIQWISEIGAKLEDGNFRELNHFHNPLKTWPSAGYGIWRSAIVWAQDSTAQATWGSSSVTSQEVCSPFCIPDTPTPSDWSWQKTRNYFYTALTTETRPARDAYFAKTFRGLGQQIHLLQDMAVPMHVRSDPHPFNRGIEKWAANNIQSTAGLKQFFARNALNPVAPTVSLAATINGLAPVARLFDTDTYAGAAPIAMTDRAVGLSEWTNANFFSDDTINLPYYGNNTEFPYPNKSSTNLDAFINETLLPETIVAEDNVPDTGFYIRKVTEGVDEVSHFARIGYWTREIDRITGDENTRSRTFILDDACHQDYAQKLLPRAVGYSAGLLDYFFRGDITLEPTSITDQYTIKNNHETEAITGTLGIYYDDDQGNRILASLDSMDNPIEKFTLAASESSDPIKIKPQSSPAPKEKGRYVLAFKGTMGNEAAVTDSGGNITGGAVAGRVQKWWREEWDADFHTHHAWLTSETDFINQNPLPGNIINQITSGRLVKENSRPSGKKEWNVNQTILMDRTDPQSGNCFCADSACVFCISFDYGLEMPLTITPDTWLWFKISEMSLNVDLTGTCTTTGERPAVQGVVLTFVDAANATRKLALVKDPSQLPDSVPHYWPVSLDVEQGFNIFAAYAFAYPPITLVEPVKLTAINIVQTLRELCNPSATEHRQRMVVDFLRLEN